MDSLKQLQNLLRDLFQLEMADLDFGLYRLLRLRHQEIESFLCEQLPRRVEEAFQSKAGQDQRSLEKEISDLADRIRKEIAEDALLENGEINSEYKDIKGKAARGLLETYNSKRTHLDSVQATESQKTEVFNHLYAFFSRYYEAGDFVPRRRYGVRESYAIPYNGEETLFHWANKDQHYVKTAETFKDYSFTVETLGGTFRIRFLLTEATLPPGNAKGDARYFFPLPGGVVWEKDSKTLKIPFHYRLPVEEETERYGKNSKLQDVLLKSAIPGILDAVPEASLRAALYETIEEKDGVSVPLLLKRMRHFCKRNTSDYFIHCNLEGFLNQELEFYIKDQVIHLSDIEGDLEAKRRTIRVFRKLSEEIIAFLNQIEDVQKRLFEKKKFVLRTDYLIPIKEVPRELWKEVLQNKAQVEAWKTLFAIDPEKNLFNQKGKINDQFLKENPTLVVDTSLFDSTFKERLLAHFEDLDEAIDGLLIHSENYQALRFLERKFTGEVKCIYIDPPYNTGSDGFIYKDRYQHSSWVSMIEERLQSSRHLLADDSAIFVSIDDNEFADLKDVMNSVFGNENFIATIIWQKVYSPKSTAKHLSVAHDYICTFSKDKSNWQPELFPRTEEANARYENPDNDPRGPWKPSDFSARNYYSKGQYEVISPSGKKFQNPKGRYWIVSRENFFELDREKRIWWGPSGDNMPALKRFLSEVKQGMVPQTLWPYSEVGHTQEAKQELLSIVSFVRTEDVLNTVKPTRLIRRILQIGTNSIEDNVVMDFFAGSGTTGDAVIRQNREDGGKRRFILVEMGQYFDDMVLQRIQRSMYGPEWKDCKPKRPPTQEEIDRTPRLIKVLRLEGYEDSLHNLVTEETLKRAEPRAKAHKQRLGEDAYRLQYLVRLPLKSSNSMLNLSALEHPFTYRLEVLTENGPKVETVDLVETFNFLYGLHVKRLENWINPKDKRTYRIVKGMNRDGKSVMVLWRDMENLDPVAEREFLESQLKKEKPFDEILINGDTATPGIRSLDGLFKRLMEESER